MEEPTPRELIAESTARVTRRAKLVAGVPDGIERLALALSVEADWLSGPPQPSVDNQLLFRGEREHAQFILVAAALNFSFWPEPGAVKWTHPHKDGRTLTGALALGESLLAAQERCVPITDAAFLERVTTEELRAVLGGVGELPMLDERRRVLNETGRALRAHHRCQFAHLLDEAGGSAQKALALLLQDFPSFRDVTSYDGHPVHLLKRAQILISDLWFVFAGDGPGQFDDIDTLTAFADYKLPQLLRATGALEFHPSLADLVDRGVPLAYGSREEVEIRAVTVQVIERLRDRLDELAGRHVHICKLDSLLWALSQRDGWTEGTPHHRTRTIFY